MLSSSPATVAMATYTFSIIDKPYHGSFPGLLPACSEAEADDEFEDDSSRRRGRGMRQAKHRAQIRANFEGSIPKRKLEKKDFMESPRRNSGSVCVCVCVCVSVCVCVCV